MCHSTTGLSSGSHSPRNQFILTGLFALTACGGWCIAFALGFWVRGLIEGPLGRSARAAPESAADRPVTSHLDFREVIKAERTEPGRPAEDAVKTPIVAAPPTTPPAEAAPLAATSTEPPPDRPVEPGHDRTPAPAAPGRFVLHQAAPRASLPFVLPENPSFALADLKLDEPAACDRTEQVCAVDRSLNTALTWARSPDDASERARKEGKLVFLIHVSGNFEDPGFT